VLELEDGVGPQIFLCHVEEVSEPAVGGDMPRVIKVVMIVAHAVVPALIVDQVRVMGQTDEVVSGAGETGLAEFVPVEEFDYLLGFDSPDYACGRCVRRNLARKHFVSREQCARFPCGHELVIPLAHGAFVTRRLGWDKNPDDSHQSFDRSVDPRRVRLPASLIHV
jgi:hypothetical protein